MRSRSSGQTRPSLSTRRPSLAAISRSMPRSASAWRRSRYDLPVETMPSRACGLSNTSAVEGVGAGERAHRLQLEAVQPLLLGERRVRPADVEAARRQLEVVGRTNCDARRVQLDRGRGVDRVVHALQADPAAAVARERKAEQAVLQQLGDAGRVHHRDHGVDQRELALVRGGRGFAGVIVAHQHEHAAKRGGAGEIGVTEGVAGAIDPRPLAVPHAEHAVVAALAVQPGLLRAPERGRGQVLVDPGLEHDVMLLEEAPRGRELLVEAAERRAAIAADVPCRVVAGREVARALQHRQADQRLDPGQIDPAGLLRVPVVEADLSQRHTVHPQMPRGSRTRRRRCAISAASVRLARSRPAVEPSERATRTASSRELEVVGGTTASTCSSTGSE